MREMKDSGAPWLGYIPANWQVDKLKYHLVRNEPRNPGEKIVLSLYRELGVIPKDSRDDNHNVTSEDTSNYKYVRPGDFVINKMKAWQGSVAVSDYEGIVSPAYFIYNFTDDVYYRRYFHYLMRSCYKDEFMRLSGGIRVGQWDLPSSSLDNVAVLIPPKVEQRAIAEFLDRRCAEIDAIAADLQSQIDVLEQYKRSVITEAVTKGLNPDAEMKDSGIEWVGMIPAHWPVHPVYTYFGERKNKNRFGTEDNLLSLSYGRVIRKDINTSDGLLPESFNTYNIVEAGDIIIRPTDLQNDKRSLRTGLVKEHGIITSAYIDLCPIKKVDSRYFHFLLHAYDVMKVFYNMGNGVRQGLNYSEFSRLMVFEPKYEEQVAIADFLDGKVAEIDGIIDQKKEQLEVLDSYKKSLIYEYVTGKKSVPLTEPAIEAVMIDPHVILAGMVIDLLGDKLKGKTQIQKLLYLFDSHLGLNLATQYYRYKHGPYDLSLDHYLNVLVENGWFKKVPGDAEKYEKGSHHAEFCDKYKDAFAQHSGKINSLVSFAKDMKKTSQIERIATIFAVWNDLILDGNRTPTDDEIIHEILTHWTPNKANTAEGTWKGTLDKMRKQGIIPKGWGLHTLPMPQRGLNNA